MFLDLPREDKGFITSKGAEGGENCVDAKYVDGMLRQDKVETSQLLSLVSISYDEDRVMDLKKMMIWAVSR
jgi:hypothetical protein